MPSRRSDAGVQLTPGDRKIERGYDGAGLPEGAAK